jgi:acetyltransferase-like isoleucine patch superfamily enzyme
MIGIARLRSSLAAWRARVWLRECARVGPGAVLEGRPIVFGGARIRIGARFYLSSLASPSHLVAGPEGELEIGDDVALGHGAAVAAYKSVRIGSGTRIGPYLILLDTDFHAVTDRHAPGKTGAIAIGPRVRIGSHVTILRGTEIGEGAVLGAGSVVSGRVPPGAHFFGVPARSMDEASAVAPARSERY